jgi:hydrogenase nickel incorporation protein HypA/HybF
MHELAIARGILEIVSESVKPEQAADIRTVRVRVGKLAGVVADSLEFCFGVIAAESPMPAARLIIEAVPAVLRCKSCSQSFTAESFAFLCPSCGSSNLSMVSGTELQVAEIELADESREAP